MIYIKRILFFALTALIAALPAMPATAVYETEFFSDLSAAHPYVDSVGSLKESGNVAGYPDGTFKPDNSVSRAEFITMTMSALGGNPAGSNCFSDVKTEWFARFVCAAKAKGLVSGYADGTFGPARNINFVEASVVL